MFCSNCGTLVSDSASFCRKCGRPLKRNERRMETAGDQAEAPSGTTKGSEEISLHARETIEQTPAEEAPTEPPKTKQCPKCQTENRLVAKFCKFDGYKLEANTTGTKQAAKELARRPASVKCPQCGSDNASDLKFCPKDGTPLSPDARRVVEPRKRQAPLNVLFVTLGVLFLLGAIAVGMRHFHANGGTRVTLPPAVQDPTPQPPVASTQPGQNASVHISAILGGNATCDSSSGELDANHEGRTVRIVFAFNGLTLFRDGQQKSDDQARQLLCPDSGPNPSNETPLTGFEADLTGEWLTGQTYRASSIVMK